MMRRLNTLAVVVALLGGVALAACGNDDSEDTTPTGVPATATAPAAHTPTPSSTAAGAVDPCTLRTSLEGQPLAVGVAFSLDASTRWQVCNGGAAAGSNEKFLFRTENGGVAWTLISRTMLGSPPPEAGVGEMPNGNGASALFFQDENNGWLGLTSPGQNLYRSTNGGMDWAAVNVPGLAPAAPVLTIAFTDATHGTFTTPDGTWTTSDGGATWTQSP